MAHYIEVESLSQRSQAQDFAGPTVGEGVRELFVATFDTTYDEIVTAIAADKAAIIKDNGYTYYFARRTDSFAEFINVSESSDGKTIRRLYCTVADEWQLDAPEAIASVDDISECVRKIYASKASDYLADSDDGKIKSLKLYGKTTQDGTATPSSPVALHSVEEINVRVTKKNMLPSPTFSGSTYGVVWEYGIPCKANVPVTFSFKVDSVPVNDKRGQLVASTDSHIENRFNPVTGEINMTTIQIAAGTNTATLTPLADGYAYFRVVERSASWNLYDMQLEHGETATAYEAYSEQARTITPPAPLHGLGTYRDVCDVDSGVWKYNIGSRLVSDRSWLERGSGTDYYTQYGISGFLKKGNTPAISTYFGTGASWGGNNANKVGIGNGDQSYCFIGKSTFPSLADCNAFMQAHDVYVYSALETPTETAIDSADLEFLRSLSTAYPQTNVFITDQDNRSIDSDFLYPMSIKTALESMRKDIDRLLTLIVNT